jgi:hypothetical protein
MEYEVVFCFRIVLPCIDNVIDTACWVCYCIIDLADCRVTDVKL